MKIYGREKHEYAMFYRKIAFKKPTNVLKKGIFVRNKEKNSDCHINSPICQRMKIRLEVREIWIKEKSLDWRRLNMWARRTFSGKGNKKKPVLRKSQLKLLGCTMRKDYMKNFILTGRNEDNGGNGEISNKKPNELV